MVKFFPDTAEYILASLKALKTLARREYGNAYHDQYTVFNLYEVVEGIRYRRVATDTYGGDPIPALQDLTNDVEQQLISQTRNNGSSDLIDIIVDILRSPYAMNTITPKVVKSLRKAILTPDELGALKTIVKEREMTCHQCQHKFVSGEAVVFTDDGDFVKLSCMNCMRPELMACLCGKHLTIPARILKSIAREKCNHTESEAEAPMPVAEFEHEGDAAEGGEIRIPPPPAAEARPGDFVFRAAAPGAVWNPPQPAQAAANPNWAANHIILNPDRNR